MQTVEFRAMSTKVIIAAEMHEEASRGLQAAQAFIEVCEQRFSRFLPASELSLLNRAAGTWHNVSDDLMDLLELSMLFYNETAGLFDPSVLPDLKRIGYNKSMDEIRTHGSSPESTPPRTSRPAFNEVELDLRGKRVRLPRGMEIDLGGIAKGWIVEKTANLLREYSEICAISIGGDIVFKGYPAGESSWRVYIEDPRQPDETVAALHVGPGAVATSSIAKRAWNQAGQVRHHIIDPRTGEPAMTDWLSVTVIAPQMAIAEVFAKALLIGGEGEASQLSFRHPEAAYFVVKSDGALLGSQNSMEYLNGYDTIRR